MPIVRPSGSRKEKEYRQLWRNPLTSDPLDKRILVSCDEKFLIRLDWIKRYYYMGSASATLRELVDKEWTRLNSDTDKEK